MAERRKAPTLADIKENVGSPYFLIDEVISGLRPDGHDITCDFKFSKGSGWYLTFNAGRKRLFYLFPGQGDFCFKMVLNDRALAEIGKKRFPGYIHDMVRDATKYPEGTLLEFTRTNFKVETITELLRIKIST